MIFCFVSRLSSMASATFFPRICVKRRRSVSVISCHLRGSSLLPSFKQNHRYFSSRRGTDNDSGFKLDALKFSISPETALKDFQRWAVDEQGLNYLIRWNSLRITAVYAPVWSFDVNVRFALTTKEGVRTYGWKPHVLEAYQNQPVVHLPGLSTYAGYTFRRSLINPVHNTTLVFMGDETVPFAKWMLRDMKLSNGTRLEIFPDPWNATRGRAFAVLREELEELAKEAPGDVTVQTEVVSARRVYMPTYVIDYTVFGSEYKAFVSGCDEGAGVSGISHSVWSKETSQDIEKAQHTFLGTISSSRFRTGFLRVFLSRNGLGLLFFLFQILGNVAIRLLSRIPLFGLLGGAFVGFRKIIRPWMDERFASAEWERQRENESILRENLERPDDFIDNGSAQRYFRMNRARILRHLSGEYEHEQGDYNWYQEWEEWARQQYEQQTRRQQQQDQTGFGEQHRQQEKQRQQQQQRARAQKAKPKPEYQWDFDPNDPYSVLGVRRGATKAEVSAAFRREMLKHHPDTQANATDAEKERATERSKLITDAYRRIKAQMK